MDIPVYKSRRWEYIRISDIKEDWRRKELDRWIFGQFQPLIQGEKGAIIDAVFLHDYKLYLETRPLTK
jgi:hypothetical protein